MGSINSVLATVYNSLPRSQSYFTSLRDWQHASKIFRTNNNAFAPKVKNWFHVFFQLDPVAVSSVTASLKDAIAEDSIVWSGDNSDLAVLGVLCKTVKLPNFDFDIKEHNQYNRKSITATSIKYQPIDISFWDDTVDTMRGFWFAYYQYMNQDPRFSDYTAAQTQGLDVPTQFTPSTSAASSIYSTADNWGSNYGMDTVDSTGILNRTNPFFRSIRIYQFNRGTDASRAAKYTEYVLVNPLITSFSHDSLDSSSNEFMQNRMNIRYETVLYNSGYVEDDEIASWDAVKTRFFDTSVSPLYGTSYEPLNVINPIINNAISTVEEIAQLRTGQSTVSSVLSSAIGTGTAITNALTVSQSNPFAMQVPTVVPGYGTSGNAPLVGE